MTDLTETPENAWPAVEAAQVFVLPSYQWAIARVDAVDSRIQALMTFVATVTLGIPTLSRAFASAISFKTPWIIVAVVIAIAVVTDGMLGRTRGALSLVDPMSLYNTSLGLSKWEFQRDALYHAGKHLATNVALVEAKVAVLNRMTWLFLLELALLFVWIARA
jgi:hypothetical protein